MAADGTIRPAHGGYQDAFAAADLLPLARELAATMYEDGGCLTSFAAAIRDGREDGDGAVKAALAALKWRFYAQPDFRAARQTRQDDNGSADAGKHGDGWLDDGSWAP